MALDFNAVSLTPLTDDHVRALEYLTTGWSRPDRTRGVASSTMGPQAYQRRRLAAIAADVLAAVVLLVPGVLAAVALYQGDTARLSGFGEALPYLLAAAALLSTTGAATSWFQTGGTRRTIAGAEPATQLTFAATDSRLVISDAAGGRVEAPWPRWRIANVRSQIAALESQQTLHPRCAGSGDRGRRRIVGRQRHARSEHPDQRPRLQRHRTGHDRRRRSRLIDPRANRLRANFTGLRGKGHIHGPHALQGSDFRLPPDSSSGIDEVDP